MEHWEGVPFRFDWTKTSDFQRLYFVPKYEPSALWVTGRMPTTGSFVTGHFETHQAMFDTALVFSDVSPNDLGTPIFRHLGIADGMSIARV